MKPVLKILIPGLVVAAFGFLFTSLYYPLICEKARQQLEYEFHQAVGQSVRLKQVGLTWSGLRFKHFSVVDDSSRFSLSLQEVRVGINPLKLLGGHFSPLALISSVQFRHPRLVLFQGPDTTSVGTPNFAEALERFVFVFQRMASINRIQIRRGELFWRWRNGKTRALLTGLEGELVTRPDRTAQIALKGRFMAAARSDIALTGQLDFDEGAIHTVLDLKNCLLDDRVPFFSNGVYQFKGAQLTGRVTTEMNLNDLSRLHFQGDIQLRDLQLDIFNQRVQADSVRLVLENQDLVIQPFQAQVEGGKARFSGRILDIAHPHVAWEVELDNYPAEKLVRAHEIFRHIRSGKVHARAWFRGPLNRMSIEVKAAAPSVLFAVVPFHHVATHFTYRNQQFQFHQVRADFRQLRTEGSGWVSLSAHRLNFALNTHLRIPDGLFRVLDRLDSSTFSMHTWLSGNTETKTFRGIGRYWFAHGSDTLTSGGGRMTLQNEHLTFAFHATVPGDSHRVSGTVNALFSDPVFTILDIKDFPLARFTSNRLLVRFAQQCHVDAYLSGPYNSLVGRVNFASGNRARELAVLSTHIRQGFSNRPRLRFGLHVNTAPRPLEGVATFNFQPNALQIDVNFPDLAEGELVFQDSPEGRFSGHFQLLPFSVTDYTANVPLLADLVNEGTVSGLLTIGGTARQPQVTFVLHARDFIVNQVGYYTSSLQGHLENNVLKLQTFQVKLNEAPVFNAALAYNLDNHFVRFLVEGHELESNFLAETLFRDRSLLQGPASYALQVEGALPRPRVRGELNLRNGKFAGNRFDDIELVFQDSIPSGAGLFDLQKHVLNVKRFRYRNEEEYTIDASGKIGLGEDGVLDLSLNVAGNVLAELPKLTDFFREPRSEGHLSLKIKGSRSAPVIQQASLTIDNGSMKFSHVLPPVSRLRVRAELPPGSRFINIETLEGDLDGRHARIYNLPAVSVEGTQLKPVALDFLGLNLGVLVLETDRRGIPLSIPGLMRPEDVGYFTASGKKAGEKFYFAGPLETPTVRGKITLYNCRVTFPFLGMEDEFYGRKSEEESHSWETENKVVEYLLGTNWDVLAVPGNNNRYFVNIPAYVGKVYLDLNIDHTSPGLEFTGRLADETFRIAGSVTSSRGRVEYLDVNFRVDNFGANFSRFELYPEVWGKAYTTVRDTSGVPKDIYLVLYAMDPETHQEVSRGRWEDFRFKLVSSDPNIGETQEQVLAYLGYDLKNLASIRNKAEEVGLSMTENLLFRPLMRPLERRLERELGLDYVRFHSNIASNFYYLTFPDRARLLKNPLLFPQAQNNNFNPALLLLQSSEVTLGKYLARNVYFTYTGRLVSFYDEARLGLNHRFGLEYRLLSNILLDLEFEKYQLRTQLYNRNQLHDFRIRVRHSFTF